MLGLAGPLSCLTDRALEEGLKGGRCHPSVSDYHITAVLGLAGPLTAVLGLAGWAAKLLDRSGSGAEEGLRGHPSVSDYHITAVVGVAGHLPEERGGFEGPSVSFGLPYNCCGGSGWAPA